MRRAGRGRPASLADADDVGGFPGEVLAAVEADHLAGDRGHVDEEADGAAEPDNAGDRGAQDEAAPEAVADAIAA